MRFLYGFVAFFLCSFLYVFMISKGWKVSDDVVTVSMAIMVAGAMAGGD